MDKKVLIRLLNHKLEEIDTLLNSLGQSNEIYDIEIDILLSRIRLFYDDVKFLGQLDSSSDKTEDIPASQDIIPEFPNPRESSEPAKTPEPSVVPEPSVSVEPPETPEPVVDTEPPVSAEPTITPEPSVVPEPPVSVEPPETPEPMVDPEPPITQNPNSNIFAGVKMQAVDDIMVAIGLNDRFLFTRELFDNDAEKFTKTINALNQKDNWNQASAYLDENFHWDMEDPTLILFLSFVKRRYI